MRSKFKMVQKTAKGVNSFITVDTGLNTSMALWTKYKRTYELTHVNAIKTPDKIKGEQARINYITDQFAYCIFCWDKWHDMPEYCVLEGVSFWGNSLKSEVAAKTGSLSLLSYVVGAIMNECKHKHLPCETLLFQEWGGQMKPEMVKERVERLTHKTYASQHTYDAVGMGLSLQGRFGR